MAASHNQPNFTYVTPEEYVPYTTPQPSSQEYFHGFYLGVEHCDAGNPPAFPFESLPLPGTKRHGYQDGYKHALQYRA